MSTDERLAQLEARLAAAEARIVQLEMRGMQIGVPAYGPIVLPTLPDPPWLVTSNAD